MRLAISFIFALILAHNAYAGSQDLNQLLRDVKQRQAQERKLNKTREAEFLAEKQNQQQLLQTAKAELAKQEKLRAQLSTQLESNETLLAEMETQLKERSGELGELFGVAKQAAGDLQANLQGSIISAQYPDRIEALTRMTESKALPMISQLENLWFTLQQEMTESGKIVRFTQQIQIPGGERQEAEITRIGAFNALANGGYLNYDADAKILTSLARQPEGKYLDLIDSYRTSDAKKAPLGIDPTRGVMLNMLIQTPDAQERIQQGGVVGYIILLIGALGFLYALLRLSILVATGHKMKQQMHNDTAMDNNPLGRVLIATEQSPSQEVAALELILDEAITREVPNLEKGLSMIKLFAAVAPLLGLLGTVTGMIATFQSISLFGTGDPKLMADGISQALVTTMLGLSVAIPLLFLHNLLASRSKMLVQILDEQSAGLMSRRAGK
ncbi:hypothetical protein AU255_00455 [Methyloprofundus sedimenti]|uniref:MotA/TolQ/ExbB proton channel domain-containing protein n=1 Tax=Methyloprofundus sedimenti TaxID=1420851 RepID=A0A1V8M4L0_9GAMM|nr:MotA/TolQ/ExbB proton channel family protein [Methyloprofundus sedimenti]OQK16416.1 hypothetical protein AU255_00455 [Methyloprofundus sedimenti]